MSNFISRKEISFESESNRFPSVVRVSGRFAEKSSSTKREIKVDTCSLLPVRSSRSAWMSRIRISRWHAVFGHGRGTVLRSETLRDRCAIFVRDAGDRCAVLETGMSALRLGAVVPADLNHALEMNIHAVGELERLEVGEADDGRARTEVLDLLEPAEEKFRYFFLLFLFRKL